MNDAFSESVLGPDPEPVRQHQRLIAEAIISMAEAIAQFARLFADLDPLDLSTDERRHLEQVRRRLDDVLGRFAAERP